MSCPPPPLATRNSGKLTRAELHGCALPSFFWIVVGAVQAAYGGPIVAMRDHEVASGFVSAGSFPVHVRTTRFRYVPERIRRRRRSFGLSFAPLTWVYANGRTGRPFASSVAWATQTFTPPVRPSADTFDVFRYAMKMWSVAPSSNVRTDGSSSSTVPFVTWYGNGSALARTSTRTGTKSEAGVGLGSFPLTARRSNS